MTTIRQIEANQRNAAKSTGPKTDEGKAKSRLNAVTHGLTATRITTQPHQEVFEQRLVAWTTALAPEDEFQEFHLEQAVAASIRIQRCQTAETHRRGILVKRASEDGPQWELDRNHEVRRLSQSLKRNPELIASELRSTPLGRSWLIGQWTFLLFAVPLEGPSHWTEAQSNEALDLLGIRKTMRELLSPYTKTFADPAQTRELIFQEIACLNALQVNADQELAELRKAHHEGIGLENDATLKLVRRYEADANREMTRSTKTIAKAKQVASTPITARPIKPQMTARPQSIPVVIEAEACSSPQPEGVNKTIAAPALKGNRLYRRKQQAHARHQAHLSRISA